jgi:hypothetical protein
MPKKSILSPKKIPSSHKDLAPIPLRGWNFLCVHMHSLTYLSTICKYYSTSSSSSYVCTCQHVAKTRKRQDIVGAKNGEKWQMSPNVGPTFSDILPTCRPTRQCHIKIADADIRQTQLSKQSFCHAGDVMLTSSSQTRGYMLCTVLHLLKTY